jgi:hypothetical protein
MAFGEYHKSQWCSAFHHEKSYPRVGFSPSFSVHDTGPERRSPKLHVFGSHNGKEVFLAIIRVRILVKPPFMLAAYSCDHVASSTSCFVPVTGTTCFSFNRERRRRPGRARGGHHLKQEKRSNWLQGQNEYKARRKLVQTVDLFDHA